MNTFTTPQNVIDLFLNSKMISNGNPTDIWPLFEKDNYAVRMNNISLNDAPYTDYLMVIKDEKIFHFIELNSANNYID